MAGRQVGVSGCQHLLVKNIVTIHGNQTKQQGREMHHEPRRSFETGGNMPSSNANFSLLAKAFQSFEKKWSLSLGPNPGGM